MNTLSNRFITADQVIDLIPGMTRSRLSQMRYKGLGPQYYKPTPKTVLYNYDNVIEWLNGSAVEMNPANRW